MSNPEHRITVENEQSMFLLLLTIVGHGSHDEFGNGTRNSDVFPSVTSALFTLVTNRFFLVQSVSDLIPVIVQVLPKYRAFIIDHDHV